MSQPIALDAASLWSKWGFEDGDILDHPLWDYEEEHGLPLGSLADRSHEALEAVVRRYLLPVLPRSVEVEFISSHHNPVRAVERAHSMTRAEAPADMQGVSVEVTIEQVVEALRELQAPEAPVVVGVDPGAPEGDRTVTTRFVNGKPWPPCEQHLTVGPQHWCRGCQWNSPKLPWEE